MKNLRLLIVLVVACIAIFFNIERLDFMVDDFVNIDTYAYILTLLAVIMTIGVPFVGRTNRIVMAVVWFILYISMKGILELFFGGRPLLQSFYIYLTVTEFTVLLLIVSLAHWVSKELNSFEDAVEKITFGHHNRQIRLFDQAQDDIQVEIFRSRNFHRPLSIIIVKPDSNSIQTTLHRAVQEAQKNMINSFVINNMAQMVSKYLRKMDLVLEQRDKNRFVIFCPETNAEELAQLTDQIKTIAKEELGAPVLCGAATFPDEAITFDELLGKAEAKLQKNITATYSVQKG